MFLVLLAYALPLNTAVGHEHTRPKLSRDVQEMLHWLPVDAESLIVVNGPLPFPGDTSADFTFQESCKFLAVGLATAVQDGLLCKQLKGQKIEIAVEGRRRFRSPKGLGMMPYEGCEILRFDDSSDAALKEAFHTCLEQAKDTIRLKDMQIAVFTDRWEDDDWTFFVTRPQPSVLLCATNRAFLEQVLSRMKEDPTDRAFPDHLPEWRHVNVEAGVWALRHYKKDEAANDPSSPHCPRAGEHLRDSEAVGFVFWCDAASADVAIARYLSGAENAADIVTKGWYLPSENLTPRIQEIEPGVIEISAPVAGNGAGGAFLFRLLAYLGHAVFL
jgi:hypothetical protein